MKKIGFSFIKDADNKNWNEYVKISSEMVTIAHNPSLKIILEESFGFKTSNYLVKKEGKVVGVFPCTKINGKIVSMPHFSYGDLLISSKGDLKKEIRKKLMGSNFEIRSFESFSANVDDSKVVCYLSLKNSEEEQWDFWKSKLRSQIRKGMKNGVEVTIGEREYLNDFYAIYSKNMHNLGSPVLQMGFFENILKFYEYGEVKIFLAKRNGITMAASMVLTYHKFAEVCWASSLREYNTLNPNMLLYWEMIKYALHQELKIFSFGRSSKDSSTLKFKRQWSPSEKQLYFNFSRPHRFDIKKIKILSKVWSKLPLKVANFLGPRISKNIY